MLKSPKYEIYKAIKDLLTGSVTIEGAVIPVYVEQVPKIKGSWINIHSYASFSSGTKLHFGFRSTVMIEVLTDSDDLETNTEIASQVMGLMHPAKVSRLSLTDFYNSILLEPVETGFQELTENGQVHRTQLRYELQIELN